jgi:hypothetical protein
MEQNYWETVNKNLPSSWESYPQSTDFALENGFNLAFTTVPHSPVHDKSSMAWCLNSQKGIPPRGK